MADLIVVEQLRTYLLDAGIVRDQATNDPERPVVILNPRDGIPDPQPNGAGAKRSLAIVALVPGLELAQETSYQPFLREPIVDVLCKATSSPRAELVQRQIHGALAGQIHFTMGDLLVERCLMWRGDQQLGATDRGYLRTQSFRFLVRAGALAGD